MPWPVGGMLGAVSDLTCRALFPLRDAAKLPSPYAPVGMRVARARCSIAPVKVTFADVKVSIADVRVSIVLSKNRENRKFALGKRICVSD